MSSDLNPAIDALERRLAELEQKANELRGAINVLCAETGMPPRYQDTPKQGIGGGTITSIKDDTFYGKRQRTAAKEYLKMRKAQGLGPAKPREIFDALKAGGYQFEAKDDEVALVGLRAMLRKRYTVFHRLPNGSYGLTEWYPDIKRPKGSDDSDSSDASDESDESDKSDASDEEAA